MYNSRLSSIDRSLDTHDTILDIVSRQEKRHPASRRLWNDKMVSTTIQSTPLPLRRTHGSRRHQCIGGSDKR